jgi:hypothetical protein
MYQLQRKKTLLLWQQDMQGGDNVDVQTTFAHFDDIGKFWKDSGAVILVEC